LKYSFQIEGFEDIYDELLENYRLFNEETDVYQRELNINKKGFIALEKTGEFKMFTIRKDKELIGQCGVYITHSMHNDDVLANEDFMFIKKEHRGGLLFYKFTKTIEEYLKKNKINEIITCSRIENGTDDLLQRMGYKKIAVMCSKRFED